MIEVSFFKFNELAILPEYAHQGDAGLDLFSVEETVFTPGEIKAVGTGIGVHLLPGTEGQIRPRSGLALKGITVLNSPGTIDEGYKGEIKIILINLGKEDFVIHQGAKIAQMVINCYVKVHPVWEEIKMSSENFPEGEPTSHWDEKAIRGTNGFGSSGF